VDVKKGEKEKRRKIRKKEKEKEKEKEEKNIIKNVCWCLFFLLCYKK
jgi:hypothetical protein